MSFDVALTLTVNGREVSRTAGAHLTLLRWLREAAGVTDPKYGCGEGICGACTVLVDGEPVSACLVLAGYFLTLNNGGWHLHATTGEGTPLHHVYQQATTVAWLGIVACQVGAAFAARTERVSLRSIGVFSNRLLLGAIGCELAFAALLVYVPSLHHLFGTAALSPAQLVVVLPFPFVVGGADELRRWMHRRRVNSAGAT